MWVKILARKTGFGVFMGETRITDRSHVIVVGNEKGGAGKTTTAMHLAAYLLGQGFKVGTLDLDIRQQSFTRYVENRKRWGDRRNTPLSEHVVLGVSTGDTVSEIRRQDEDMFASAMGHLRATSDFVLVDCPGADSYLSRLGHATADTLISPINDSFVDFDLLANVDPDTLEVGSPSIYSDMVWECRKARMQADQGMIDWVVMKNRTSHLFARNRDRVDKCLDVLSKRLGFRLVTGLSERVIFREMFPAGLTLLDLTEDEANANLTMSHVAARAEIRNIIKALKLPGLEA